MVGEKNLMMTIFMAVVVMTFAAPPGLAGFQEDQEKLLKAAQKEGKVQVFICCGLGRGIGKNIPEFEKKYGIKVIFSSGSSREQAPKVLAERKAGKYTLDLWMGGLNPALPRLIPAGALQPLRPLLYHPEVLDPNGWFQKKLHWFDKDQRYVLGFRGNAAKADIAYNTKLVDPKEIQSYWDLLDPKWKGKIIMRDPRVVGASGTTAFFYLAVGPEWLRRLLTEQDVTVTKSARQAAEKLALGKYAICLFACTTPVRKLKKEGHPVENAFPHYVKEAARIAPGGGALYAMANAPNPNAQKFFANWWLTKEGQTLMQKSSGDQSMRSDISVDAVYKENRREAGKDYIVLGSQKDYQGMLKEAVDVSRKALESVGK